MRRAVLAAALLAGAPLAGAMLLGPLTLGCSNLPAMEPPPPAVRPAPAEVAHLAVYVFQLVQPPVTPEDEWDYRHTPGYTAALRRTFQAQLQQAGFTVVLDRATPADLVATVQSDMPHERPGVATLVLAHRGRVVDRLSVPVHVSGEPPKTVHHAAEAAVRLVEAMSRSIPVATFAREVAAARLAAPSLHAAPPSVARPVEEAPRLNVAGAACPPPRDPPPAEPEPPQIECRIAPIVRCQPPSPVRSAWQPHPFTECPREVPSFVPDVLGRPGAFSPRATRERRLDGACGDTPDTGACCYVQFTAHVCL